MVVVVVVAVVVTHCIATITPMMHAFLQDEYPHTSGVNRISSIVPV